MRKTGLYAIAVLAISGVVSAAALPADADRTLAATQRLAGTVAGQVTVKARPQSGAVNFVRVQGAGDLMPGPWAAKGRVFLREHGNLFGLRDADRELTELYDRADELGQRTTTYQQLHDGVPVFGARFKTAIDKSGRLTRANGSLLPHPNVSSVANIGAGDARQRAVEHLQRSASPRDLGMLAPSSGKLYVYNAGFLRHRAGRDQLVYEVEVNGENLREFVYIDAHTGKIADQITGIYDAIDRRIYEGGFGAGFLVWQEGDATPIGTPAWDNLVDYTLDTYNLASSISGGTFLSWNGADGVMHAVNNHPAINCPNAQFTGSYIRFCDGTTTDDIVGHEWFHGYTQETHGLIYLNQSGAINEAYSDIFGEVIDLLNQDGNDFPDTPRSAAGCSAFSDGVGQPVLTVNSPAAVAGDYLAGSASFNPSGAFAVAASVVAATPNEACSTVSATVSGSIALIDRGDCTFTDKVLNAQTAGAVGVIVANNQGDGLLTMSGAAPGINIPSVFVGQSDGASLRNATNVTATLSSSSASDNSYRWLMGEDSSAFNGAIRDMWTPNCLGDPGRVSDPLYACDPNGNDAGGVHSNSGIINHGFALLVDGGAYNGQTIGAIGLTKAAHLYWRAMITYQVPTTGYADHAAALEASCDDLTGVELPALSTELGVTGLSGETITANDCAQVEKVVTALELNESPTQCGYTTLLAQDPPAICAAEDAVDVVIDESFDSGLSSWVAGSRAVVNSATFDVPNWIATSELPFGRPGQAAFGANPVIGNCTTDIEAGVTYLESPAFTVPAGGRLVFEHSVSTEKNYDGGNLKASVNGASFELVPGTAFDYNAYNGALFLSDNPLGGEAAFHGSDGGTFQSAFGESHVDLMVIANAGDQVKLRFELGADGCNGLIGWYLDRVRAFSCDPDFDGDGNPNVSDPDDDNDGMSDVFENSNGLNPFNALDAAEDPDNDGLTNLEEYNKDPAMNPNNPDTDGDGLQDNLDNTPTIGNVYCTGDTASLDSVTISGAQQCAAKTSVTIGQIIGVTVEGTGSLEVIAPLIDIESISVIGDFTVINADPCPDC